MLPSDFFETQIWIANRENPTEFDLKRIDPIRSHSWIKPYGGLWTSTLMKNSEFNSSWEETAHKQGMFDLSDLDVYSIEFDPSSKVYVIDDLQDLKNLLAMGHKSSCFGFSYLDFEKLMRDYDAIHLTDEGQWETRLTQPNLYGWDCECTLWLNPKIRKFEKIGKVKTKLTSSDSDIE